MGEPKRLSKNELMRVVGVSGKQSKKITWHTTQIIVKQFLSLSEYVDVVRNIISDCKTDDGSIAIELVEFSIRSNIISAYSFICLPEDINSLYEVLYISDLYETICSHVNKNQIDDIKRSVYSYIN